MTIPHKPFGELSDAEKGALLLAHHEGKRIDYMRIGVSPWHIAARPCWDDELCYRIAPEPLTPDTINWEHVSAEINAIARHSDDRATCFGKIPTLCHRFWDYGVPLGRADVFASYRRGTVDWKDSLVIRPGYEGKP